MAQEKRKVGMDIDGLRSRTQMVEIIEELENKSDTLTVSSNLIAEVRSYLDTAKYIPKKIDVHQRKSVDQAQEALQLMQARVDRILMILMSSLKIDRALGKLELLAKQDLGRAGIIDQKTSSNSVKQIIGMILPELAEHQMKWGMFIKLLQHIQEHLGDAKDTIRLQIRLDENANWSQRYSG